MTTIPVAVSLKCTTTGSDGEKIEGPLNKFLNKASKGLGEAFDMIDDLDTAVSEISDAMSGLTSKMSTLLQDKLCLLYTSPSPRDRTRSRMPSSA